MLCTAFEGSRRIAAGEVTEVALKVKKVVDRGPRGPVLVFDDTTSESIELDLRGSAEDVTGRLAARAAPAQPEPAPDEPRGPGRPKLGVVAREITLLPRHWEWLGRQPGGASVTLRKLVEEARKASAGKERVRQAQEAAYRFMSVMAGDRPGFEEATRALFAGKQGRFDELVEAWPADIRAHARKLAAPALGQRS
jgi:uncharacterized protein